MAVLTDNHSRFARQAARTQFGMLSARERTFIRDQSLHYRFTQQELRQIVEMAMDFQAWHEMSICDAWPSEIRNAANGKSARQHVLNELRKIWQALKNVAPSYQRFGPHTKPTPAKSALGVRDKPNLGLGYCPVSSTRTRCCNLMTLDAVENCGFGCSYCSIQSFYRGDTINFDSEFAQKLQALKLDPNRIYHIGTGQSSDSLLWGNKHGVLEALVGFAYEHPNVILELKTKSKNISYLLNNEIPANILCTWSLNTPTIITHEEHQTASLTGRLAAARKLADRGILVGFHFHPLVHYDAWRTDYAQIFDVLLEQFDSSEVALVSLGTLTFTKSVIRTIRSRRIKTKVLQLPLVEADGKLSYPEQIKLELFRFAYQSLESWHTQVFFYLCMENPRLWKPVFGLDYPSNDAFEAAMKSSYMDKIRRAGSGTRSLK
jgi:spore photoproduct lyase